MIIRHVAQVLSPAGRRARLSILIFHRVLAQPDPLMPEVPDIQRFDAIVGWVRRWFNVIPLEAAARQLRSAALPARAACISFDDGYADNVSNALPVLLHHRVPATFFVSTAFLDGGRMWNDSVIEAFRGSPHQNFDGRAWGMGLLPLTSYNERRRAIDFVLNYAKYLAPLKRQEAVLHIVDWAGKALRNDLMMGSEQLIALRDAHMQVGAHTVSHPILENVSNTQAMSEIVRSKGDLQNRLDQPVTLFAYPNGKPGTDYSARHVTMVREAGYEAAVSTLAGAACTSTDPYQLPRFTPWDRSRLRFGARMLVNM